MDRLIASNTVPQAQADTAPATGTPAFATDGNPSTNVLATQWPAYQYNAIQEELIAIIAAAGLTPNRNNNNQILAAIRSIVAGARGTFNGQIVTPSSLVLNASQIGAIIESYGSATGIVLTLPSSVTIAAGGCFTISNHGANAIQIASVGADQITSGQISNLSPVSVQPGDEVVIISNGSNEWDIVGGSAARQFHPLVVGTATASAHAMQFGQASGVVGQCRNLLMSISAASASATLSADEIIVESALGGLRYCLSSFSKTINVSTTGAGGMDTGSAPASGFVAIYAILNPSSGATALLATDATSAKAPEVYGGTHMPTGYTASALVSVWPTTSGGLFGNGFQTNRTIFPQPSQIISTSVQQTSPTLLSIASIAPKNAKTASFIIGIQSSASGSGSVNLNGDSGGTYGSYLSFNGSNGSNVTSADIPLITPQTIYYKAQISSGTMTFGLNISSYKF
ncbi:hypothetical protein [Paraburkholderia caballeronis]|uniref:Uncharacterized protein n=1 Tax=Paraburkholderia caballeronis TaxID=416943 RepID=A0A1H7U1D6_9BURK|nr:hypothetical protein [Paraburkholderia caballeronis]PXW23418.1 hypothetical protein C7403_110156 [Paraburkholderia caballeronis]PXW98411.1 hypothetical protein C7407_110156 [Paraburkholderia caballeronis]RAJ95142.1 hypothetical protein C7409_110157 [Paraburkholderia caballeronis]SEC54692.1 hypothetical protein SAMN05445871_2404 [Paraburkholderia caballeronis]SEL90067.1 hypothetical protein SAMN05192542_11746 [Paraburkholderia caballeronis]